MELLPCTSRPQSLNSAPLEADGRGVTARQEQAGKWHCTRGLCPLPYLLLRHLLVGEELVNFPVVLEAPGKEEDCAVHSPAVIPPATHSHELSGTRGRLHVGITRVTLGAQ